MHELLLRLGVLALCTGLCLFMFLVWAFITHRMWHEGLYRLTMFLYLISVVAHVLLQIF